MLKWPTHFPFRHSGAYSIQLDFLLYSFNFSKQRNEVGSPFVNWVSTLMFAYFVYSNFEKRSYIMKVGKLLSNYEYP